MKNIKKTRRQQAEETKVHIFNTALKMLEDRDFESIKVRDIVREANVSIGTFYNYYSTKMDVFYETYQLADMFFEETVEPELVQATVTEKIFCFFDYYAKYSSEITDIKLTKLLYNSNNKFFDRKTDFGMKRILTNLMSMGLKSGELKSDNTPEEMALFLLIAVRGLVYNWCTNDGNYNLREATRKYVNLLLRVYQ